MAKDKKKSQGNTTTRTRVVTSTDEDTKVKKAKGKNKQTATPTKAIKDTKSSKEAVKQPKPKKAKKHRNYNIVGMFIGYLKGAWYELRQVRWPNRKETWGLTLAVILFSAFFVVLILVLDYVYGYLFDIILKR